MKFLGSNISVSTKTCERAEDFPAVFSFMKKFFLQNLMSVLDILLQFQSGKDALL